MGGIEIILGVVGYVACVDCVVFVNESRDL